MIGGHEKFSSVFKFAAISLFVGGVSVAPAQAGGSVGGDCCADLEERVAELEATTVRKGNRKVSLKLSGQINKALLFWDSDVDGDNGDSGVYIIDNDLSGSRFRLTGGAKITSDLAAGFAAEFEFQTNDSDSVTESNQGGNDDAGVFNVRKAEWYLKSATLGKMTLGWGSSAADGIAEIDLSGTKVASYSQTNIAKSFIAVEGTAKWSNLDGNSRNNRIRYDSPTIAGFILSASWGYDGDSEDLEELDLALRMKHTIGDFKVAGGIAYFQQDENTGTTDVDNLSGSISVYHVPTGLNVTFAAGDSDDNSATDDDFTYWYIKGGIKQKVFPVGATAFSVDYYSEDLDNSTAEPSRFGVQLVQYVDSAAMEFYLAYQHLDDDAGATQEVDSLMVGSRIKF